MPAPNAQDADWEKSSFSFHPANIEEDRKTLPDVEVREEEEEELRVVFRDNTECEDQPAPEVRVSTRLQKYFTRRRTWTERFQDWFRCIRTIEGEEDDEVEYTGKVEKDDIMHDMPFMDQKTDVLSD